MNNSIKRKLIELQNVIDEIPEITYAGNPILRQPTKEVPYKNGLEIADKLSNTLLSYRKITNLGRGLAAPQIGLSKSVFVTYIEGKIEIFINPKIIDRSAKSNFYKEVCISCSIIATDVERPEWITLKWIDEAGKSRSERFDGFKARLYQHEEAHLQGRLNLDDTSPNGIEFVNFEPSQEKLRITRK